MKYIQKCKVDKNEHFSLKAEFGPTNPFVTLLKRISSSETPSDQYHLELYDWIWMLNNISLLKVTVIASLR